MGGGGGGRWSGCVCVWGGVGVCVCVWGGGGNWEGEGQKNS